MSFSLFYVVVLAIFYLSKWMFCLVTLDVFLDRDIHFVLFIHLFQHILHVIQDSRKKIKPK